jgi:pimeloyl-ACP methyl ester carboxylesterase
MNKWIATFAAALSALAILLAGQHQRFDRADAGGPQLRLLMSGSGNPAVVFEAGAGGPLESWLRIQPDVSAFARTLSYDRAGNGLSQKGATPRDGQHVAAELHVALQNAGVPPPYILVGHSLGGPYIRVFAGLYPHEVVGLVLVDPTQEELIAWAKARNPESNQRKFRPQDEVDCAPLTFAQAHENPVPTDIPVFLIAGMGPRAIPAFVTKELRVELEKDQQAFYPAKLTFYKEWLGKFPRGELIVTENSGHGIPFEEPELVVSTIRRACEVVRKR